MSKFKICLAFVSGVAVGAIGAGVTLKKVYDQLLEERVNSVKEAFGHHDRIELVGEDVSEMEPDIDDMELPFETAAEFREANREYRKMAESKPYTDYAAMHEKPDHGPERPVQINGEEEREQQDKPYVISPDEFGEFSDYSTISLICFEDGVITDREFEIVDNVEEHIGKNACSHIGDYEPDAVHIRNDAKKCDYEILKDERLYANAISQEPPRIKL